MARTIELFEQPDGHGWLWRVLDDGEYVRAESRHPENAEHDALDKAIRAYRTASHVPRTGLIIDTTT